MPFNPSDYGTPTLWLDPTDATKFSLSGSNITSWTPTIGSGTVGNLTKYSGSDNCQRIANAKNSNAAVQLNASQNTELRSANPLWSGASARTLAAVWKDDTSNPASLRGVAGQFSNTTDEAFGILNIPGTGCPFGWTGGADSTSSGLGQDNNWHIVVFTNDGSNGNLYNEFGMQYGPTAATLSSGADTFAVGMQPALVPGGPATPTWGSILGFIGDVIAFNAALSGSNLTNLIADLVTRWDISTTPPKTFKGGNPNNSGVNGSQGLVC